MLQNNNQVRVGIMGVSAGTGLLRTLQEGFAKSDIEIISLRDSDTGGKYRQAVRSVDVVQVTAWDTTRHWVLPAFQARLMGRPVVRYWVGTDVFHLEERRKDRLNAKIANTIVSANVAKSDGLHDELKGMGIASRIIPAPHAAVVAEPFTRPPQRFTVLAYVSRVEWKWKLYGGDLILQLAQEHPEWQFLLLNHHGKGLPDLPNLQCLERVPPEQMNDVYARASVLVRLTEHDGLPRMILEALARGLHVVWSQRFPQCRVARSVEECSLALKDLAREPRINSQGVDYIRREFDPGVIAGRWSEFYHEVLERR